MERLFDLLRRCRSETSLIRFVNLLGGQYIPYEYGAQGPGPIEHFTGNVNADNTGGGERCILRNENHPADPARLNTGIEVDETRHTTSLQLRFSDHTREDVRFNLHHTVADIRTYFDASRPLYFTFSWWFYPQTFAGNSAILMKPFNNLASTFQS